MTQLPNNASESLATEIAKEIHAWIRLHPEERGCFGFVGAPGSGKTTLVHNVAFVLECKFGYERKVGVVVIPMDGYHYSKAQLRQMEVQL